MSFIAIFLAALVALLHVYIFYLEMFAWERPRTRKSFGTSEEFAKSTKALAANQGLYNGFLAAGLIWGLVAAKADVVVFFLLCVAVAGIYGAISSSRKILFIQTIPALVALVAVVWV
ncbi:putative membrane protein [Celeribacter baekdonensis]|jgi:putative membrane protein|uniref:Putative membrane protein n=1 Tax=Celeribacter baekdonensis TaxID=875171 RepID=A0A1G7IAA6_9RHOB|nr:DUF1304 domain-containing protein [Celeribacter baekdonensis]SDF09424.1 putative membrane protein [Celeribacter baekdonensis]